MRTLYTISVWLHILATTVWVGGMLFLVLVVVPWLRAGNRATAGAFLRETGRRFRDVAWICFVVLIVTGSFNLWMRGVRISDFFSVEWRSSTFGMTVLWKIGLVAVALVLSAVHDFVLGPRATAEMERDPRSAVSELLRRRASLMGRANALLALAIVFVAVLLVRGVPW